MNPESKFSFGMYGFIACLMLGVLVVSACPAQQTQPTPDEETVRFIVPPTPPPGGGDPPPDQTIDLPVRDGWLLGLGTDNKIRAIHKDGLVLQQKLTTVGGLQVVESTIVFKEHRGTELKVKIKDAYETFSKGTP